VFQFIDIMAKSRFEYVKLFEKDDSLLPNTWIIVRLDGRGFHGYGGFKRFLLTAAYRFSRAHAFTKPNDINALNLMNHAAKAVMRELSSDIVLGYGDSDEYRSGPFLFEEILTTTVSYYPEIANYTIVVSSKLSRLLYLCLQHTTCFIGKIISRTKHSNILLPLMGEQSSILISRMSGIISLGDRLIVPLTWFDKTDWEGHINNLHNTTFWALVSQGMSEAEASKRLEGTESSDKNEILWAEFGTNYTKEPAMFRKGTVIYREVHHYLP